MSTTWTDDRPDPPATMSERQHWHKLSEVDQQHVTEYRAGERTQAKCSRRAKFYLQEHGGQ